MQTIQLTLYRRNSAVSTIELPLSKAGIEEARALIDAKFDVSLLGFRLSMQFADFQDYILADECVHNLDLNGLKELYKRARKHAEENSL